MWNEYTVEELIELVAEDDAFLDSLSPEEASFILLEIDNYCGESLPDEVLANAEPEVDGLLMLYHAIDQYGEDFMNGLLNDMSRPSMSIMDSLSRYDGMDHVFTDSFLGNGSFGGSIGSFESIGSSSMFSDYHRDTSIGHSLPDLGGVSYGLTDGWTTGSGSSFMEHSCGNSFGF